MKITSTLSAVIVIGTFAYLRSSTVPITAHEIEFGRVSSTTADTLQSHVLGNDIELSWYVSGETSADQPEYPSNDTDIRLVVMLTDTLIGQVTYVYADRQLTPGIWQVRIRCARTVDDEYLWSSWSMPQLFNVIEPPSPPLPPYSITIKFK